MSKQTDHTEATTLTNPITQPLSDGEQAIIKYLSPLIIEHSTLQQSYEIVQKAIFENTLLSEPSHTIIVGDSGCGKTTLCDMIADEFGTGINEFQLGSQRHMTALMASVPSPVTPRSMAINLLRATGDQSAMHGTALELTERLIHQIKECDIQVVFFDEAQHFYSLGLGGERTGPSRLLRQALDWIKSIINRTGITFVLMGLPSLINLINADEQLSRRFSNIFYLKPFDYPKIPNNELAGFVDDLLLSVVCELPYFDAYDEFSLDLNDSIRLYLATSGTPARVKNLVIEAACQAYRANSRQISMGHFASAYHSTNAVSEKISQVSDQTKQISRALAPLSGRKGDAINPFSLNTTDLFSINNQVAA